MKISAKTFQHRDLTVTPLPNGSALVISCDSCGSVGHKPADVLQAPPYISGRFTARVALMEVLSFGAEPVTVTDAVSCEMDPTGAEIIRGVRDELKAAGFPDVALTGSTEENFPSQMTALGITVVGYHPEGGGWPRSQPGDLVICVGLPKVGDEICFDGDPELFSYEDVRQLRRLPGLRELIPTGSGGILSEAENAAAYNGLRLVLRDDIPIDLRKSTGPASCGVAILAPEDAARLALRTPVTILGTLETSEPPARSVHHL